MCSLPAALLATFVCTFSLGGALPDAPVGEQVERAAALHDHLSSEQLYGHFHVVSASDGYLVQVTENINNNSCTALLNITGNGINKTVNYPCGKAPTDITIFNKSALIGDEWFSDEPKVLIHLKDGLCERETFSEEDGRIKSVSATLGQEPCDKIHKEISELKEKQKNWKEEFIQQQAQLQHGVNQLVQNLNWFQQQMFGGLGRRK